MKKKLWMIGVLLFLVVCTVKSLAALKQANKAAGR